MKKLVSIIALLMVVAMCVAAMAEVQKMYIGNTEHSKVKMFAKQDDQSKVVKNLDYGQKVNVVEWSEQRDWAGISYKSKGKKKVGWVKAKYLCESKPAPHKSESDSKSSEVRYVTKDGTRAYKDADTASKVIKKLAYGAKVTVVAPLNDGSKWMQVSFKKDGKKKTGWVKTKYLSKKQPKATAEPTATPNPEDARKKINAVLNTMQVVDEYAAQVSTQTANGSVSLRWEPTTEGKLIAHLENGHPLTVLAEGNGWFQVRDDQNGYTGFMSSKYIARTVVEAPAEEAKTVEPQPYDLDPANLPDGIYPVAFDRADLEEGDELVLNDVSVFTMDVYDIVDINTLAIGDTVVVEGKPIEVESIEQDGDHLIVNGGMDEENGVEFVSHEEDNCYRVLLYDDHTTYTNHGSASLVISPDAVYTDSSNLEEDPLVFSYDDIPSALASSDNDMFIELNTTVRMEAGKIAEITRVYIP